MTGGLAKRIANRNSAARGEGEEGGCELPWFPLEDVGTALWVHALIKEEAGKGGVLPIKLVEEDRFNRYVYMQFLGNCASLWWILLATNMHVCLTSSEGGSEQRTHTPFLS